MRNNTMKKLKKEEEKGESQRGKKRINRIKR